MLYQSDQLLQPFLREPLVDFAIIYILITTTNYLLFFNLQGLSFLFATVFFFPLRVRALFLVLCPRKGKPIRCLIPLYAPISINRLMFICTSERKAPSVLYSSLITFLILVNSSSFQSSTFFFSDQRLLLSNIFCAVLLPIP